MLSGLFCTTKLKTLLAEGNQLQSLSTEIGQLQQLRILMLGENQLSHLPETMGQLTELRVLIFDKNKFTAIPGEIAQLHKLKTLRFWDNALEGVFGKIGQLRELRSLDLSSNQLTALPPEFAQLNNLQSLYLSFNQLTALPPEVAQLNNLKSLDLSSNQLTALPPEVAQLNNLKSLNLSSNQLTALPPVVAQLNNLKSLYLSYNQLTALPPVVAQLNNLKSLDLSYNQLTALPPEVALLNNLQSLNLSANQLTALPPEVAQLNNLQSLYLRSNQLTDLPAEVALLNNLQSLYLFNNQLTALPPQVAQLNNLQSLDLSANQLTALPPQVAQLNNLQSLSLSNNQLTSLPAEIKQLSQLQKLDLRGNPIPIPPEILGPKEFYRDPGNLTEILDFYFQTLDPAESEPLYEAKFLIVGEGGAGKTTLAKKIDSADYELQPEEKSTEGIDVIRWDFDLPNGHRFRANIWDFGGQEIYHATHQFFLTKRSLYAIVVDTRQDNTDLYYWLNVVELLSDNSPVFIIKNEKQDRTCQVNERQLRGEFTNLKETLATNLKDNRGLDEIKAKIQQYITTLPHVGTPLPKIWVRVRACLENYAQNCNYIPIDKYYELCEQNQFQTREQMLSLSRYLHDLGVCLHFHDDPLLKKTLILKPEWGTTAVYKALDTQAVKDNLGRFSRAQLDTIWDERQYADMRDELLQLMVNFKVCYKIPGTADQYIAPQLLAVDAPDYSWDATHNLQLRYKYDFMPKGILTRFIVEMHEYIQRQKLVWKNGVVLYNGTARAEVIEKYHKGEIHIRLGGSRCRDLLIVVSHELDKINASYEKLKDKCHKLVPCPCDKCQSRETPHFFPVETLHNALEAGRSTFPCEISFQEIDVRTLLYDISDLDTLTKTALLNRENPTASINHYTQDSKQSWAVQTQEKSAKERLNLLRTIARLPAGQFEELVFALDAPQEYIAGHAGSQSERAKDLLKWAESPGGCGLFDVEEILASVMET